MTSRFADGLAEGTKWRSAWVCGRRVVAGCGRDAVVAWFAKGLEEGSVAERLVGLLALVVVDAPLADEGVLQDLAGLESQACADGREGY